MRKTFLYTATLAVTLSCTVNSVKADSYPSIQGIYAVGEYVFLNGIPEIKIVDGKILRLKDDEMIDVKMMQQSPQGDLWGREGRARGYSYHPGNGPLVRYDGKKWTKYELPVRVFARGGWLKLFFLPNMTIAMLYNPAEEGQLIPYLFDGNGFIELTPSEKGFVKYGRLSYSESYTSGDKIFFTGENRRRYDIYDPKLDTWQQLGAGEPWPPRDEAVRRNGDHLVNDDEGFHNNIAISDNAEYPVWGSKGGCHLAFLRDGKWIEVALLHAVLDGGGPGSFLDPMREAYGKNGMSLAVIDDADGYVNVRANPSINAPVTAIILEDVTFMYDTIPGNSAWVKVLLPSGTKGYLANNRLKHVEEEPFFYKKIFAVNDPDGFVNLYARAGTEHEILSQLANQTIVARDFDLPITNGWIPVGAPLSGYIHSSSLEPYATESTIIMTTKRSDKMWLTFSSSDDVTIDWGDGTINTYLQDSREFEEGAYSHTYPDSSGYTLTIIGVNITWLECEYFRLTHLDVSNNKVLHYLNCGHNQLTNLDLSQNTMLQYLICWNNQLTSLDVSQNTALKEIRCYNNQLTSLNVSRNTALKEMYCGENQLTSIDVSQSTLLTDLSCGNNQLTNLNVSRNSALTSLGCSNNQLTSLDVSQNTLLTSLYCDNNQLTSLDVSRNTALKSLSCNENQLTRLAVSKNTVLRDVNCRKNQLQADALDDILRKLMPKLAYADNYKIDIVFNPGTEGCTPSIATKKGWNVFSLYWNTAKQVLQKTEDGHDEIDEDFKKACLEYFGTIDNAVQAYMDFGWEYFCGNDLYAAEQNFNQAWLLNPEFPDYYFGFAALMEVQGENSEAKRFYNIGHEKDITKERAEICYRRIAECKKTIQ